MNIQRDLKVFIILSGFLVTSGCSYEYKVRAEHQGSDIVFTVEDGVSWFGPDPCIDDFQVLEGKTPVWHIQRVASIEFSQCENDFPILYGRASDQFKTIISPKTVKAGTRYGISGFGRASYTGEFEIGAKPVQ